VTAIAYETVEEEKGKLPILEPMSEIAGRISALMGAYYQANPQGGRGVLFGGMPGVLPAHVVVLGGGTVGENAARVALGMGSHVTILERRSERMRYLDEILPHVETLMADPLSVRTAVSNADILIGAVHVAGARTPQLVTRAMVRKNEIAQRHHRCRNRSGRKLGNIPPYKPCGSCVHRRRRASLLRTEYAGRLWKDINLGADERHIKLYPHDCQNAAEVTTERFSDALQRNSNSRGTSRLPACRRSTTSAIHTSRHRGYSLVRNSRIGFTLIELMLVVAIIGILAAIGVANYANSTRKSGEALTKGNLGALRSALSIYYSDTEGIFPTDDLTSITNSSRYLVAIPLVRTQPYHADNTFVTAEVIPTETGGWSYNNVNAGTTWGNIYVGCFHQDMQGQAWSRF